MTADLTPLTTPELRTGTWTRFGDAAVLGDAVTERAMADLAESTRAAARSQGYAVGWAEGRRAARDEAAADAARVETARAAEDARRRSEHDLALAALRVAAEELAEERERTAAALADRATDLTWELTRCIVGSVATEIDAVRRALDLSAGTEIRRLLLHPADVEAIDAETRAALAERDILVGAEDTLDRGDALVEAEDHVLDLRIATALERVREVLR